MSTPINPKPQARKPPGSLLESRKKEIKTTINATCVSGLMLQELKMSIMKLHYFFLQNILPQKNLIGNVYVLGAGSGRGRSTPL